MKVKEIMTSNPVCCTPDSSLREAAKLMCDHDCGEIPVVDNQSSKKVKGVITDRDITCRSVALGKNPLEMKVQDCFSNPAVTVKPDDSLEHCCRLMEEKQIRRIPVVDQDGCCCGIISQADIARHTSTAKSGEVLREVSYAEH